MLISSALIFFSLFQTSFLQEDDQHNRFLLAVPTKQQLQRILAYVLDEDEFLSEYGIRSMSKFHEKNPFTIQMQGEELRAEYTPGESNSYLFGGNSNWRGPIWFPMNYLVRCQFSLYSEIVS